MANLDPATLEKFQRFQAMLAASPEIVEALNSPEILALAAKAAEKKNAEPEPEVEPEPEYPVVGYGVSDDVSVMSEMTTPTVMTRQTVEEDEFYPEIDVAGKSSSGMFSGPRRIGLKIGVGPGKDSALPPPPPKTKPKSRHHRSMTRKIKPIAPMSKIVENDRSVTENESIELKSSSEFDSKGKMTKKTRKPMAVSPVLNDKKEPHPFLASSKPGTARRTVRTNSYSNRIPRRGSKSSRGINRNRSMPVNIKINASDSSESLQGDDSTSKTSSENNPKPSISKEMSRQKSSPSLPSLNTDDGPGIEQPLGRGAPAQRGVIRNRSLPVTPNHSTSGSVSSSSLRDDDDTTKTSGGNDSSSYISEANSIPSNGDDAKDDANLSRGKMKRVKSVPKMRVAPIVPKKNKSVESSPAMLTRPDQTEPRQRGRSLSKKKKSSNKSTGKSRSPKQRSRSSKNKKISYPINDDDSQGTTSDSSNAKSEMSMSVSSHSEKSNGRPCVTRRWRPPCSGDNAIPPAFRSSSQKFKLSSSNHSTTSIKSYNSRVSVTGSESEEPKESQSEEQKDNSSSGDEEADYVPQTVRKPAKIVVSRPDPALFKQYLSEVTQVVQGDTSRPDDYLPGSASPFTATRKKKGQPLKKRFSSSPESGGPRSEDWIGAGKVAKRTWKAKKPVEC
mmetsp:Transcript_14301/g.33292  ORF Transcript_14301/g.33292 Transcript_14301/m.33292 type:complete len:671 (-) Transcript_14301:174-2186(-)|eukprot:CAMPEP_0197189656 /NCGR_PEP_ID=MMETSP1423-20130617/20157_1 /TAXON_ID=476441 /ORGANISM="Pseudo-nitzschia heimii, Strain UNC1101" /LENGTH=670 /DNA_ID=CAMNT_0042641825 /DNA_START=125 /DNA_END=2137 /DNA_ORIENTATION=-